MALILLESEADLIRKGIKLRDGKVPMMAANMQIDFEPFTPVPFEARSPRFVHRAVERCFLDGAAGAGLKLVEFDPLKHMALVREHRRVALKSSRAAVAAAMPGLLGAPKSSEPEDVTMEDIAESLDSETAALMLEMEDEPAPGEPAPPAPAPAEKREFVLPTLTMIHKMTKVQAQVVFSELDIPFEGKTLEEMKADLRKLHRAQDGK